MEAEVAMESEVTMEAEATREGSYTTAFEMSPEMEGIANRKPGSSVELGCLSLD